MNLYAQTLIDSDGNLLILDFFLIIISYINFFPFWVFLGGGRRRTIWLKKYFWNTLKSWTPDSSEYLLSRKIECYLNIFTKTCRIDDKYFKAFFKIFVSIATPLQWPSLKHLQMHSVLIIWSFKTTSFLTLFSTI